MKVVFMGTPEFARAILAELVKSSHEIFAVVTGPDKPVGRKRKLTPTAVKAEAERHGLKVITAGSLRDGALRNTLADLNADLFVVAAFRILPPSLFDLPQRGAINIHASLLPKYRGAAPINWAIINGETETGLTSFFLKKKVDTGDMILQEKTSIASTDTYDSLHERLSRLAGPFTLKTLAAIESGRMTPVPQSDSQASPAPKIQPEDAEIDFDRPSVKVKDFIRGMATKPGAFTYFRGDKLKVHFAAATALTAPDKPSPGTIVSERKRLLVACGEGAVELLKVVPAGKKEMDGVSFINGFRPKTGESMGKAMGVRGEP
jgi:methionyl-tRNA formyltransferase